MKISLSFAALGAALAVAAVVAFVLRPAQLAVRPAVEPVASQAADAPAAGARPGGGVHARPRSLVYVAGAVVHPGVYAVAEDARARDALAQAGGSTRDADLVAVNLAAHVSDGDEIAVPRQGEAGSPAAPRSAHRRAAAGQGERRRHRRPRRQAPPRETAEALVDLNTADESALADLPGIGPALAERIVDFRTLNGPFASVDGLADVAGITPQRLDALAPLVTAGH